MLNSNLKKATELKNSDYIECYICEKSTTKLNTTTTHDEDGNEYHICDDCGRELWDD